MSVRRVFVEKKDGFDIEARSLYKELHDLLGIDNLLELRILYRYDVEDLSEEIYLKAKTTIFSEPPVDKVYDEELLIEDNEKVIAIEYLPGQYGIGYDDRRLDAFPAVAFINESA